MNIKVEINQEKEPESLLPLADNAEIEQIVHGIVDGINEQFGTVFRAHMPLDLQKMILDTFRKPKADEQVKVMKVGKVSTHSAAIGGVAGALIAFSFKFAFNPVWWLCLVLILGGMVGTARIILRQHTLSQVVTGYLIGFLCAFNMIIRF